MATLFDNNDGSGASYDNVKAWGSFKELANLEEVGFNDAISSFSWNNLTPKKEIVTPVDFTVPDTGGPSLVTEMTGVNDTPDKITQIITLDKPYEQSTTVTVTNQYTAGMVLTYNYGSKGSLESGGTAKWSVQLSFDYTHTESTTMTETESSKLEVSQNFPVPAYSSYQATLTVQIGTLPPNTNFQTPAERWYDTQLDGSTQDPANNNWWKRSEIVTFQMGGSLAAKTDVQSHSDPLPGHGAGTGDGTTSG